MIELALLFILTLYASLIIFLINVAFRFPGGQKIAEATIEPVSIVIPCKNEAHNLPRLIASIKQLEYPAAMEVVFIDDDSVDDTATIIEQVRRESGIPIRLLKNRFEKKIGLTSKQQALDLGIREALYPCIALTDADMSFDKQWLLSLAVSLKPGIDLVFGHTAIIPGRSFFALFQSFQLAFLFSIAALFHYCGIPGSCMGNNILLRKTAYLECGGYTAIGYAITEDRALLRQFRRCGRTTGIVVPFLPTAFTAAHSSRRLFFQQAARWVRGGFSNGIHLLAAGLLFTLQNSALIAGAAGLLSERLQLLALVNTLLTWMLLLITFKKLKPPVSALLFPFYFPLLIIETILLIPALFPIKRIIWKGRPV